MEKIEEYSILIARIEYADGTGSKSRPAMVLGLMMKLLKLIAWLQNMRINQIELSQSILKLLIGLGAGLEKPSWLILFKHMN